MDKTIHVMFIVHTFFFFTYAMSYHVVKCSEIRMYLQIIYMSDMTSCKSVY